MRLYSLPVLALPLLSSAACLVAAVNQTLQVFAPGAPDALLRHYVEDDAAQIQLWRLTMFVAWWLLLAASVYWFVRLIRANRRFAEQRRALGLEDDAPAQ